MATAHPRRRLAAAAVALGLTAAGVTAAIAATPQTPGNGISMSVRPSQTVIVPGGEDRTLTLTNTGSERTTYFTSVGDFDVSPVGLVRIDPPTLPSRSAKRWVRVQPAKVTLRPGESAPVRVRAEPSRIAAPGDHQAVVLFVSQETPSGDVRFRARIGVPLIVRVSGDLKREVRVGRVKVVRSGRNRVVLVSVNNLGNVAERFTPNRMAVEVLKGRKRVAKLRPATRLFLPGSSGFVLARYTGRARGVVTIRATFTPAAPQEAGPGIASTPSPIVRTAKARF